MSRQTYNIEKIFPISDRQYFYVHLKEKYSLEVEKKYFLLVVGAEKIELKYRGFTLINSEFVLLVELFKENKDEFERVEKLVKTFCGLMYLEEK